MSAQTHVFFEGRQHALLQVAQPVVAQTKGFVPVARKSAAQLVPPIASKPLRVHVHSRPASQKSVAGVHD